MTDGLEHLVREAEGDPVGALVLLHGRGADEHDLVPLLDALDPKRRFVGVTPRGPLLLPPGGAHWYVVKRVGFPDPDSFFPTYERLTTWLDSWLADRDISYENVVLGGFSQGAVMSYALTLGPNRPRPAALLSFSGFIPTVDGFDLSFERTSGLPVSIGHGTLDPIISVEFGRDAKKRMEEAGADVQYRESEMGHSIDPGWVRLVRDRVDGLFARST